MQTSPVGDQEAKIQLAMFQKKQALETRIRNGANWFFWIAGLSFINTIIYTAGGTLNFVVGLGATQVVDGFVTALIREVGPNVGLVVRLVGLVIDLGVGGLFIVAGILSRKRIRWAIIAGIVLYALDALIFVWVKEWFSLAFHILALMGLAAGLRAIGEMTHLETAGLAASLAATPQTIFPDSQKTSSRVPRTMRIIMLTFLAVLVVSFLLFLVLLFNFHAL